MLQVLAHLWGDYLFQTDRMARLKTRSTLWASIHALTYSLPFVLLAVFGLVHMSVAAWVVIVLTHAIIDRFRLARFVVAAKNAITDPNFARYYFASPTGYLMQEQGVYVAGGQSRVLAGEPAWMAVWLLIIADNALHLSINYAALRWL